MSDLVLFFFLWDCIFSIRLLSKVFALLLSVYFLVLSLFCGNWETDICCLSLGGVGHLFCKVSISDSVSERAGCCSSTVVSESVFLGVEAGRTCSLFSDSSKDDEEDSPLLVITHSSESMSCLCTAFGELSGEFWLKGEFSLATGGGWTSFSGVDFSNSFSSFLLPESETE